MKLSDAIASVGERNKWLSELRGAAGWQGPSRAICKDLVTAREAG